MKTETMISLFILIVALCVACFMLGKEYTKLELEPRISYLKSQADTLPQININMKEIYEKIDSIDPVCKLNCGNSSTTYYYEPDYGDFFEILKINAGKTDYILNNYDCTEFSESLKWDLKDLGFIRAETYLVNINCDLWATEKEWIKLKEEYNYGYEDCLDNNLHQIVCINGKRGLCIESTTGDVIMPKDYGKYGLN